MVAAKWFFSFLWPGTETFWDNPLYRGMDPLIEYVRSLPEQTLEEVQAEKIALQITVRQLTRLLNRQMLLNRCYRKALQICHWLPW